MTGPSKYIRLKQIKDEPLMINKEQRVRLLGVVEQVNNLTKSCLIKEFDPNHNNDPDLFLEAKFGSILNVPAEFCLENGDVYQFIGDLIKIREEVGYSKAILNIKILIKTEAVDVELYNKIVDIIQKKTKVLLN